MAVYPGRLFQVDGAWHQYEVSAEVGAIAAERLSVE